MTIAWVRYVLVLSGGWCLGTGWARHDLGSDWIWLAVGGAMLLGWWLACVGWEGRP